MDDAQPPAPLPVAPVGGLAALRTVLPKLFDDYLHIFSTTLKIVQHPRSFGSTIGSTSNDLVRALWYMTQSVGLAILGSAYTKVAIVEIGGVHNELIDALSAAIVAIPVIIVSVIAYYTTVIFFQYKKGALGLMAIYFYWYGFYLLVNTFADVALKAAVSLGGSNDLIAVLQTTFVITLFMFVLASIGVLFYWIGRTLGRGFWSGLLVSSIAFWTFFIAATIVYVIGFFVYLLLALGPSHRGL